MQVRTTRLDDIQWPSREEWARRRRTIYADMDIPDVFVRAHDALVPDSLRLAAVAELEALWTVLGKHIRGAQRRAVNKLYQAKQITFDEAIARSDTPADHALTLRHEIRHDLKHDRVHVPAGYDWYVQRLPVLAAHPLTAVCRYHDVCKARWEAAFADWERAVQQTPIDDAAWAKELEWRAREEDERRHPERFIHHVG